MIPSHMLPQRATVEPHQGTTGAGKAAYGPPAPHKCSLTARRRVVTGRDGKDVVAEAQAIFKPDAQVNEQDRVTCDGRAYTVVSTLLVRVAGRPHSLEVALK